MRAALAVTVVSILVLPVAAAHAETRTATLQDAAGDALNGGPDLAGATVTYDTAGGIEARVTYAVAPPTGTDIVASVELGEISGSTCQTALKLGAFVDARGGQSSWLRPATGAQVAGTARLEGLTLIANASSPAFAADVDCVLVRALDENGMRDGIQAVALKLPDSDGDGFADRDDACPLQAAADTRDGCPPPPPTPKPAPEPKPEPTPEPVPPKPVATALERYDAAAARCPTRPGTARKRCLSRAAKANKKGAALARKRRTNPFLGKAFLRTDIDVAGVCGGACMSGWVFPDDRWAYRGLPEKGPAMPRCVKETAVGDKDGCLRYRLSADRRTAIVGAIRLKITGLKVIDAAKPKQPYFRVAIPAEGARYDADLNSISSYGITGVNQSFVTSDLTLDRDGRFVTATAATGTNNAGSDFENSFAVVGDDKKGTYAFEPGGTLALTYASGRVTRRSAFVAFGPKGTLGTVPKDGLFLNGSPYLPED